MEKLLSLCIPTYNRCEILDTVLSHIVRDKEFDERVEVVVSDNCSTDATPEIVKKYSSLYTNVVYHRNPENIRDANFELVLSLGTGKYVKLLNDYSILKAGTLGYLLERIEKHKESGENLFFYTRVSRPEFNEAICYSLNDFVEKVSFWSTWIGHFGTWKERFDALSDKERCRSLQLSQMDWTLRIVNEKSPTVVYRENLYETLPPSKKGGYNFFKIFVENYLGIYQEYLRSGALSSNVFKQEKRKLFKRHLYLWLKRIYIKDREMYCFETKGTFRIIFKHYWSCPYLYINFVKLFLYGLVYPLKRIFVKKKG